MARSYSAACRRALCVPALIALLGGLLIPGTAAGHGFHDGLFLAHRGTPVLDGVIGGSEYGDHGVPTDGVPGGFGCYTPAEQTVDGVTYKFALCESNDDSNDYYAFQINDPTPGSPIGRGDTVIPDKFSLLFDDEHDGIVQCPALQDRIAVDASSQGVTFVDGTYCGAGETENIDAVQNIVGVGGYVTGQGYVLEFSHPLNSGDSADYTLGIHDTVGFCLTYVDSSNGALVTYPKTQDCLGSGPHYAHVFKVSLIDGLLDELGSLVAGCKPPCRPQVLEKLLAKVNEAIAQSHAGDADVASHTLDAFIKKAKRSASAGKLSRGQARAFVHAAKDVQEHIANSPSS
jgi:hypothetical protein